MTWIYIQNTGEIYHNDKFIGKGYSGNGMHKNNSASQSRKSEGPIPKGKYRIISHTNSKGPMTIILEPSIGNQMYGRSAFRIHGDSIKQPGTASEGCIILNPIIRRKIINSTDKNLEVK